MLSEDNFTDKDNLKPVTKWAEGSRAIRYTRQQSPCHAAYLIPHRAVTQCARAR
ncbi:hypothetical protein OH492_10165 [Vibrio chagasii]|nr:hypothetical protein [Vibrio chagasii]